MGTIKQCYVVKGCAGEPCGSLPVWQHVLPSAVFAKEAPKPHNHVALAGTPEMKRS